MITPERQFWLRLIEVGLLAVPRWNFLPDTYALAEGGDALTSPASTSADRWIGHVSTSYCFFFTCSDLNCVA